MNKILTGSFGLLLVLSVVACTDQGGTTQSSNHHHWRGPGSYGAMTTPATPPAGSGATAPPPANP